MSNLKSFTLDKTTMLLGLVAMVAFVALTSYFGVDMASAQEVDNAGIPYSDVSDEVESEGKKAIAAGVVIFAIGASIGIGKSWFKRIAR